MLRILTLKLNIPSSFLGQGARKGALTMQFGSFGTTAMNGTGDKEKDHLTVTSNQSRDSATHEVIITKMWDMSPAVKHLTLYTPQRPVPFTFKAGQWIDMFIPGVEQVGGFSITSSPTHLNSTGELHLAIKNSDSPPAKWVHTQCKEGCTVSIRVGGDFFLNCSSNSGSSNFLFISGGVGINPLASMIAEIRDKNFTTNEGKPIQVTLLFSAKTNQELIFHKEFDEIQSPCFRPHYFVTGIGMNVPQNEQKGSSVKYGRITPQDIQNALHELRNETRNGFSEVHVYLCGPSEMTSSLQNALTSLGVKHIFFEKWW